MKTFPSFVFAALGVALLVLGIAGIAYGDGTATKIISALVVVIGLVQIVFGGIKRTTEDDSPRSAPSHSS